MKVTKIVFLVLALVLPVLIFIFLKFFGKNQFDVAPLFMEGVELVDGCLHQSTGQYKVPAPILEGMFWTGGDSLILFYFPENEPQSSITRIKEAFGPSEVPIVEISTTTVSSQKTTKFVQVQEDSLLLWKKCYLFISKPYDLILVDHQRRIRGFYQSTDREEVDRLLMEASIILKKY
ncbi:MAG: hypothetical protein OEU76_03720 [Cyclobacteriaceae bacterium]|nr:hypothetical protein [Cyclobacteriaceae bacterium]